jgi:hypothetical protein
MLTQTDLKWLETTFLPKLADTVKDKLKKPLDDISTKLDKFVGDIEDKRETQELHTGQHTNIDDRLNRHHTRLSTLERTNKLPVVVDD